MQANGDGHRELIETLQLATRDLVAVALQSLDAVHGIKLQHMRLMIAVHEHPGAASVMLADILGISPSSVTRQADRLCEAGYLTREQHPDSRRVVVLRLTPDGQRVVETVLAHRAETFARAVPALDPELRDALGQGLAQLHDALWATRSGVPISSL